MHSKFFYEIIFKQYELAYNSYKDTGSSMSNLIKTLFTIITLIIGYVHYLINIKMQYSPLIFVYISLGIFILIVFYGLFLKLPKGIPFLNPDIIYNDYYELEMTDEEFNISITHIMANIVEDTITIHNSSNKLGKKLRDMQFATIVGLLFLGLSLLEYVL
jgi:hypothetical protein